MIFSVIIILFTIGCMIIMPTYFMAGVTLKIFLLGMATGIFIISLMAFLVMVFLTKKEDRNY